MHSVEGGTGSGYGARIMERISVEFGKKLKTSVSVFPSITPKGDRPTGTYNSVLSIHNLIEHTDSCIILDNASLYKRYIKLYDQSSRDKLNAPNFTSLNQLVASSLANVTSTFRFSTYGESLNTLQRFHTNMVPYPQIHFLGIGHTQLSFKNKVSDSKLELSEIDISV